MILYYYLYRFSEKRDNDQHQKKGQSKIINNSSGHSRNKNLACLSQSLNKNNDTLGNYW